MVENSNKKYRVLHVEDFSTDVDLAAYEIKKALFGVEIKVVEKEEDFVFALETFKPHIVVSDYSLPTFTGMKALKIVLEKAPDIPVIILTGSMNEDTAVDCLKAGAANYVIKEHIKRLGPAILSAFEQKKIKEEKEKALEQIQLLSTAVEKSPLYIVITDINGNIEYVNPKFTRQTGYSFEEVKGRNMRILKSEKQNQKFYRDLWDTILSGKDWSGEMLNKKKNGELYWENASIASISDENGKITHFIGIKEDITEKKEINEELIKAKEKAEESDRLKSAFLTNMSHEIRTPMNGILGFAGLLNKSTLTGGEKSHYIGIIEKSAKRLLSTLNDIIDISKIEAGQVEVSLNEVNVSKKMFDLIQFFSQEAQQKGLKMNYVTVESVKNLIVKSDENKLESIFSNLLKNAVKYTVKGEITVGLSINEKGVMGFYVKDTGIGIPRERMNAIFNRFEQADIEDKLAFEGSGLGLAITKSYVEMLGGTIAAQSTVNVGSTFTVRLPLREEKKAMEKEGVSANTAIPHANSIKNITLLVAEDYEASRDLLALGFKNKVKSLLFTRTGNGTIEAIKQHPETDVILMDIKMPDGDGLTATRKIRKFNREVIIIAQTAYALSGDREKAMEAGCDDYISKPFDLKNIEELISNLLKKKINN